MKMIKYENSLNKNDIEYLSIFGEKLLPKSEEYRQCLEKHVGKIVTFKCKDFEFPSNTDKVLLKHFFIKDGYINHIWIRVGRNIRKGLRKLKPGQFATFEALIGKYRSRGKQNIGIVYLISMSREDENDISSNKK